MKRINAVELRRSLAAVLDQAEALGERVVIHRRGKDAAAIIPIEDLKLLERLIREEEDRLDIAAARAARAESDDLIPLEQVRRKLGLSDEPRARALSRPADPGRRARPRRAVPKGS